MSVALNSKVIAPAGLPGAQTVSRYVGSTAGGPPVAGTFQLNDWIITPTGIMICVVGGTPGTWQYVGPGFELAYDEVVANETRTGSLANASMSDPLTITFPCPATPFMVETWAFNGSVGTAGGRGQLTLGSPAAAAVYAIDTVQSTVAGDVDRLDCRTRLTAAKLGVNPGDAVTFESFKKVFNAAHTLTIVASAVTPIVLRATTVS